MSQQDPTTPSGEPAPTEALRSGLELGPPVTPGVGLAGVAV